MSKVRIRPGQTYVEANRPALRAIARGLLVFWALAFVAYLAVAASLPMLREGLPGPPLDPGEHAAPGRVSPGADRPDLRRALSRRP